MTIDMAIFMREPPLAVEISVLVPTAARTGGQIDDMPALPQILPSHRTRSRCTSSLSPSKLRQYSRTCRIGMRAVSLHDDEFAAGVCKRAAATGRYNCGQPGT